MQFKYCIYIGLIVLATLLFIKIKGCVDTPKANILVTSPKLEQVQNHSAKNGDIVSSVPQQVFTAQDIKALTDSIKVLNKIKGKITSVAQFITKIDTVIPAGYVKSDSLTGGITASQEGRYDTLFFVGNTKSNTGRFHLQLTNDTLTYIETYNRHFFKRATDSISIIHSNKLVNTTMGDSYTTKERIPKFSFGPTVGVQYLFTQHKASPYIGIGVTYDLFTLYKK